MIQMSCGETLRQNFLVLRINTHQLSKGMSKVNTNHGLEMK
jgi:hypothetical protein